MLEILHLDQSNTVMYNIYQSFKDSAAKYPDQTAVADIFGKISYKDLYLETEALKSILQEKGIEKGHAVAIVCSNSRHFAICLYASVACGALVMPVSHQQKLPEIESSVKQGEIHFVLGDIEHLVAPLGTTHSIIDTGYFKYQFNTTSRSTSVKTAEFIENPAFMRFTSGTTGDAKGVILSHESVLARINAANEVLHVNHEDRIIWVFPMAYHFVVTIVLYIKCGATILIQNDFLAERLIAEIEKHQATFLYCSPLHIRMLNAFKSDVTLNSLRKVICTTAGLTADAGHIFLKKFKIPVEQAFGIIEVGLPLINDQMSATHPKAVGKALPAYNVKILDDEGKEMAPNEIGHLAINGPGMFGGYLTTKQRQSEVLQNGYFYTGDLATRDANGLITIKGRKKNVIMVHGNKVFPMDVEDVLNSIDGIEMSLVYGQQHQLVGEIVVADVVGDKSIEPKEIIDYCRRRLSAYKVPQKIQWVEAIELTASGKIRRN